ncbi:MAG: hypothetical protein ACODAJ_05970, partial [Planctomycetota bacterium]
MNPRPGLLFAVGLLAAGCAPLATRPVPSRYLDRLGSMPDFYQADRAYGPLPRGGRAYCGPTAAANALVWLDTHGFADLLPAAAPGPQDQLELIRTLGAAKYMHTHPVRGTGPAGIMRGIRHYCSTRGYAVTTEYAGWRTESCRVAPQPAVPWMLRSTMGASSLILNVGWYAADADKAVDYTRTGGHYVTVAGYERRDDGIFLHIHDPAKRSQRGRRDSIVRCPVRCRLTPLPKGRVLRKKKDGG